MIGGNDIIIEDRLDALGREVLLRLLRAMWPAGLLEDATIDGDATPLDQVKLGAPLPSEILVYRDAASRDSWLAEGANGTNGDSMIHILAGDDSFTCVVHGGDASETAQLVAELPAALVSARHQAHGSWREAT